MQPEPPSQQSELIGQTVSHYQILDVIGQGGMGIVYRAMDVHLQRTVALKALPPGCAPVPGAKRRLQKEARSASSITHPNVAHVYELVDADGLCFLAMEFVEGEPLDRKLVNGPLDERTAIELGIQIADALAAAHAKRIVHRDIKPANIIVTSGKHVKVLDFGLAKIQADESSGDFVATVTRPGIIMGSVHYMSPEQALGEEVDARTDIFSVGAVLYEMVTGTPPFHGISATEVLSKVIHSQPEAIGRYTYSISPEFERIIRKCIEKDKSCRYQSAAELAVDLRNLKRDFESSSIRREASYRFTIRRRWSLGVLGTLGAAAATVAGYYKISGARALDTIAVLPILNLSGDAQLEYLSDGITENLINRLSHVKALTVRPRNSVMRYKERYSKGELDLQAVGRELKVKAVLTARLLRDEGAIVVSAELTDVQDNRQIWGDQFRQTMSSIFLAQEQAAREIAEKLNVTITAEESRQVQQRSTQSSEAQHLYLKGRFFWNRRTEESLRKAIEYFEAAIQADPRFALAYSGLADSYMFLGNIIHPREVLPRAKAAANEAIELDPSASEPYATAGYIALHYDWNWAQAESLLRTAIRLNPHYPTAHSIYGRYLSVMGRFDEALAEMREALDLDPLALGVSTGIGLSYYLARQYDLAIQQHRKTLEIEPRFALARFNLARAYTQKHMYGEAITSFQEGLKISSADAGALAELGYAYARAGRAEDARDMMRRVLSLSQERYVAPYFVALIHAGLSETTQAIARLEQAYEDRSSPMVFLKTDPQWDELRPVPEFRSLLTRLALK